MGSKERAPLPPPLPPPPFTVLRGHRQEVAVVRFVPWAQSPLRLLSGDASGACLLWNVAARRPLASFQASRARQSVLEMCAPGTAADSAFIT